MPESAAEIAQKVVAKALKAYDDASVWNKEDQSNRNKNAEQASRNNWEAARGMVLKMEINDLYNEMEKYYHHCKHWEEQFREWGGFDNEYAELCHKDMKNWCYEAMTEIQKLTSSLTGPPAFQLKLLFSCDGKSKGEKILKMKKGSKVAGHWSAAFQAEVKASIGATIKAFTGSLDASIAPQVESSADVDSYEYQEEELTIQLDHPMYIYQVQTTVSTGAGDISMNGAQIFSGVPLQGKKRGYSGQAARLAEESGRSHPSPW